MLENSEVSVYLKLPDWGALGQLNVPDFTSVLLGRVVKSL